MRAPIAARRSEGTTARAVHKKYWESTGCQHSARAGSLQALNALPRVTWSLAGIACGRRTAAIGVYDNGIRAQQQTHQRVFLQCLRTPVREIVDEAQSAAGEAGALQRAKEDLDMLLPNNLGGGSRRHFIALVKSVSALLRRRQAPSSR